MPTSRPAPPATSSSASTGKKRSGTPTRSPMTSTATGSRASFMRADIVSMTVKTAATMMYATCICASSFRERWQVAELAGVGDEIDGRDEPGGGREADDGDGPSGGGDHDSGEAVDDRRPRKVRERTTAGEDLTGDRLGPADGPPRARAAPAGVGAEHHVGVEDGDQTVEVAVAGGGEKRIDELGLPGGVGVLGGRRS